MSGERASSAVRNLRSLFENKAPDQSPDTRGRSRSGLTAEKEDSRPTSRVRASFVSVEPNGAMATAIESGVGGGMAELKRESSAGVRRGSFSENSDEGADLLELKKTVSQEGKRREKESNVAEAIPEAAVESAAVTPLSQASKDKMEDVVDESPMAHKEDKAPANPDKPTTAAEEEPSAMQPADPANEDAVSGGEALPPVAEDLRPNGHAESTAEPETAPAADTESQSAPATKALATASKTAKQPATKSTPNGKPSPIATKAPTKPSAGDVKSPASQPKTPKTMPPSKTESPRSASTKQPAKKASRSSLTAPTAASVARAAGGSDRAVSTSSKQSKPREGTKPTDLPSRLTAPTAASKAKHEPTPAPTTGGLANGRASTASKPKPQSASAKPTPRTSLSAGQRPASRASQASRKPPVPAADGSFLERMMRPTAASANKTHKTEPTSPPKAKKSATPPKPKANGQVKKGSAPSRTSSRPSTAKSAGTEKSAHSQAAAEAPQADQSHTNGDDEDVDELVKAASDVAKEAHVEEPPAVLPVTHGALEQDKKDEPTGNETPVPHTNGQADEALEATPAFGGGEDTIR